MRTRKSISRNSDPKTIKDFRDWLPKEKIEDLFQKSKENNLSEDEKRELIEEMSYFGCTLDDIATALNTTGYYIQNTYKEVTNRAFVRWRYDLRRAQATNAFFGAGNPTMLIWLGKQYLSQKEDPQLELKRDKFDEFIEWMKEQAPSSESPQNSKTLSSTQTPEQTSQ